MNKVIEIPVNSMNLTVEQLCDDLKKRELNELLCLGYIDGELLVRCANRLSRKDSLWLLEQAKLYILELRE